MLQYVFVKGNHGSNNSNVVVSLFNSPILSELCSDQIVDISEYFCRRNVLFVLEEDRVFPDVCPHVHLDEFVRDADDVNNKTHQ